MNHPSHLAEAGASSNSGVMSFSGNSYDTPFHFFCKGWLCRNMLEVL